MTANFANLTPRQQEGVLRLQEFINSGTPTNEVLSLLCTALLHICLQSLKQGVSSPDEILGQVVTNVRAGINERIKPN